MLVEPSGAATGVNYPLRGVVQPDGTASLAFGKVALVGRFDGAGGFAGRASTGPDCLWTVAMSRQPPIASAAASTVLLAQAVAQGEVPRAPTVVTGTQAPSPD